MHSQMNLNYFVFKSLILIGIVVHSLFIFPSLKLILNSIQFSLVGWIISSVFHSYVNILVQLTEMDL